MMQSTLVLVFNSGVVLRSSAVTDGARFTFDAFFLLVATPLLRFFFAAMLMIDSLEASE